MSVRGRYYKPAVLRSKVAEIQANVLAGVDIMGTRYIILQPWSALASHLLISSL